MLTSNTLYMPRMLSFVFQKSFIIDVAKKKKKKIISFTFHFPFLGMITSSLHQGSFGTTGRHMPQSSSSPEIKTSSERRCEHVNINKLKIAQSIHNQATNITILANGMDMIKIAEIVLFRLRIYKKIYIL